MSEQIKEKDKAVQSRRGFLKGAGVAGIATAISVLSDTEAEAKEVEVEKGSSGYRETDHVKSYYEAAKF